MSKIKNKSGLTQNSGTTNTFGTVTATSFVGNLVGLSTCATSATTALNATNATSATTALNATNATSATTALNATNATSATTALNATSATTALSATTAISANTLSGLTSAQFLRSDVADVKTTGNLRFNDNICATFGTGDDIRMYHNGTSGYIENVVGNLFIRVNGTENTLVAQCNAATCLYYNGLGKFSTTSIGATTSGVACATSCFTSSRFCSVSSNVVFGATSGCGCAISWLIVSDVRRKKSIHPYECGLEKVNQLKPVNYQWKHNNIEDIGFIAQDVLEVEPKLVIGSEKDCYGLDYSKFTAITVKAIQELSCEVKTLKEEINILKNK